MMQYIKLIVFQSILVYSVVLFNLRLAKLFLTSFYWQKRIKLKTTHHLMSCAFSASQEQSAASQLCYHIGFSC